MRAALLIAAKDLRTRVRNRTALIVAVIAPFGLAAILGTVIPTGADEIEFSFVVADVDASEVSAALADGPLAAVAEAGIATVSEAADADAARAAIDEGDADVAFILPAGFGTAVLGGQSATIELVADGDEGFAASIGQSLADAFVAELDAVRISVATALSAADGPPPAGEAERLAQLAVTAGSEPPPIRIEDATIELAQIDPQTYFPAAMAIFFLFFTAQFGPLSLLQERANGTLARLLAAPIQPGAIVLGKALGSFVLGVVATFVLVIASTFVLGAQWGDPVGVALLVIAAVVAATGITAMITALARTEAQADGWNSIVAVTLAILGGTFIPLSQAPELLGRLRYLTPHGWFMSGLDELGAPSAGAEAVVVPVVVLVGIGLVTGAVGYVRASRQLVG